MHRKDIREHELFCAWVAGFVDGEGCITISRRRTRPGSYTYYPLVAIVNTVRAPLEEIQRRAGVGALNLRVTAPPRKPTHQYQVTGPDAQRFVAAIRPYLRIKGAQADLLACFVSRPRSFGPGGGRPGIGPAWAPLLAIQHALWEQVHLLNRKGVPVVADPESLPGLEKSS